MQVLAANRRVSSHAAPSRQIPLDSLSLISRRLRQLRRLKCVWRLVTGFVHARRGGFN